MSLSKQQNKCRKIHVGRVKEENLNLNRTKEEESTIPALPRMFGYNEGRKEEKEVNKEKINKISILDSNKSKCTTLVPKNIKRIMPETYVQKIIKSENIICLNNKLYIYDKALGYYRGLSKHQAKVMIKDKLKKKDKIYLVKYDIDSIYSLLMIEPKIQFESGDIKTNSYLINCKDCVIDLQNNRIREHSPKDLFFNCINASYNSDIDKDYKGKHFYKFLNSITQGNDELKKLLQEVTGYAISNINNAKKLFILYGVSNSGKSVYLDLLEFLIGYQNISNIPLQKLSDERYSAELFNKVANIYNELPDEGIRDLGQIKALVSPNDRVIAKKLYEQPFSFKNKATLIFATNNLPELKLSLYQDRKAYYNRLLIIPFMNAIKEKEQDKELINKLEREIDIIFLWAIKGLVRYINNGYRFSKCTVSKTILKNYIKQENLFEIYVEENIREDDGRYLFFDDIKESFTLFMRENDRKFTSKDIKILKEYISMKFNIEYTRIHRDGKNKRGFVGISFV
ncbi:phage/plasmid primase, P4 family [Clostridium paraputrificum]|uniref:DNA primase family protein n=1 Tax=Clostridium paraputrificum TaxID=29363 RepID=UPI001899CFE9|nr:phage/plasmid primase, P4 family [Clostridium paraputrificum]MDC0802633.1 phage/plasmid primase, P4 family [Clostridium paraputrificum]